jgi:hypothetical protein
MVCLSFIIHAFHLLSIPHADVPFVVKKINGDPTVQTTMYLNKYQNVSQPEFFMRCRQTSFTPDG